MLTLLIGLSLCVFLHLGSIYTLASFFKLSVHEMSIGVGPTVFRSGPVRIGLVPLSGFLRFADIADAPSDSPRTVLEDAPLYQQVLLAAVGPMSVLVLAYLCVAGQAFDSFLELPSQLFSGALSPFATAQELIRGASLFLATSPFFVALGVVAAKHSACNLLPFPGMNGGALLALLGRAAGLANLWPRVATGALQLVLMLVFALWATAISVYVWRSFA
jgi:membrane-associated protease RseP (regulator of RpoE activity)